MKIAVLDFFRDYLSYVQTGTQSPNLDLLTELIGKKEGSRKWVHSFTDLDSDVLENLIYNLLEFPVATIQKNPNYYFKLIKTDNYDLARVIIDIKKALEDKELCEQKIRASKLVSLPAPTIMIPATLPKIPVSIFIPPAVHEVYRAQRRAKVAANIVAKRNTVDLKNILFFVGGLVLIMILAILLRRYLTNLPRRLAFFSPPADNVITPALDGMRVNIDCTKIVGKFADCRTVPLEQVETYLELLKVDETAVFTNTQPIYEKLVNSSIDGVMQFEAHHGTYYSAIAKVMRDGRETLVAPCVSAMACLMNVLKS